MLSNKQHAEVFQRGQDIFKKKEKEIDNKLSGTISYSKLLHQNNKTSTASSYIGDVEYIYLECIQEKLSAKQNIFVVLMQQMDNNLSKEDIDFIFAVLYANLDYYYNEMCEFVEKEISTTGQSNNNPVRYTKEVRLAQLAGMKAILERERKKAYDALLLDNNLAGTNIECASEKERGGHKMQSHDVHLIGELKEFLSDAEHLPQVECEEGDALFGSIGIWIDNTYISNDDKRKQLRIELGNIGYHGRWKQGISELKTFIKKRIYDIGRYGINETKTGCLHLVDIKESLKRFKKENPDPSKVAFIMMEFGKTGTFARIEKAIKDTLKENGLKGYKANDKTYNIDKFANIRTFMEGCGFGIAVFEQIETKEFNPNVALEVGYMLAHKKDVCALKEKCVGGLPSDIVKDIYVEFPRCRLTNYIKNGLTKWLRENEYVNGQHDEV